MRRLLLLLLCAVAVTTATAAQSPASSEGLALFDEVWKTINDSFYDPTFGGLSWTSVRDELRPKAAAANSTDDARAVVNEMLGRLKRSHFALLSGSATGDDDMVLKGDATVEIDFRIAGNEVIVTDTSHRRRRYTTGDLAPVQSGSRILSIDGKSMAPRAGEPPMVSWRRVNAALHGVAGSRVEIVHVPPVAPPLNTARTTYESRDVPSGQVVQFSNLPPMHVRVTDTAMKTPSGRSVGVIEFNIWLAQINEPVAKAVDSFRGSDGIVFDLRGNPGGLAAMISNLAGHIIATPELLGTMKTRQVPQLKFIVNPRTSTTDGRTVKPFAGPVAILVDEMTASASECFAGALQDLGRARVFGRTSMGAALPASTRRLANGDVLEYVIGDFVTSKGRSLEGSGVVPDEIQPLSIAALAAGKDEPMAAALAWIDRQARQIR